MERDSEDDALAWSGDDDPTLVAPSAPSLPGGYSVVGKGSAAFTAAAEESAAAQADEPAPAPMSNTALLLLGVLGGVYLLYTIGWLLGGLRLQLYALGAVPAPFYYASFVLAVAAPFVWFATTYLLTRGSRAWQRFAWLFAGAVLLVPWPFLMVGSGPL